MSRAGRESDLWRVRLALLVVTFLLTLIGVLFVHSTTTDGLSLPSPKARAQIIKAAVAVLALLAAARLDYRWFERHAVLGYALLAGALLFMLAVRFTVGGGEHNRFLRLGFFQVQPSAFMLVGLIVALARYLRFREDQRRAAGLVAPFLLTLGPMALVCLQPNLGLSLLFPPVLVGMLFVSGSRPRHLAIAVLVGLASLPAAYLLGDALPLLKPYQRERLRAYVVRHESTHEYEGYQLNQSLIAVGSGGFTGKGFSEGTQNRLGHLPERHTDFIFSIIAEESGVAGAAGVLLLFLALVALILRVALLTREPFGRLVATGLAIAFAVQCFENVGMTLGLTPITGIPLPFVSLAGSGLVANHLAIGMVLGIASHRMRVVAPKDLDPPERRKVDLLIDDRAAGLIESRWPT